MIISASSFASAWKFNEFKKVSEDELQSNQWYLSLHRLEEEWKIWNESLESNYFLSACTKIYEKSKHTLDLKLYNNTSVSEWLGGFTVCILPSKISIKIIWLLYYYLLDICNNSLVKH